jgi:elongation factor G
VDSSDIAFQVAGTMAFKKVAEQAGPKLLEPIMEVLVTTPDDYVGDIMGDITQRRGRVLGMDPQDGRTTIRAQIPEAELYKYASTLRSLTQGRAYHTRSLIAYEYVPELQAQKVIEVRKKETADAS